MDADAIDRLEELIDYDRDFIAEADAKADVEEREYRSDVAVDRLKKQLTEQITRELLRKYAHPDNSGNPYCGVILAGGTASRLGELSRVTNKHLLPVGYWPMIYYPIRKLVGAGIREVMIVTGTDHMGDFVELLGSGKSHGARFTYRVQDQAGGVAQALGLAEWFCNGCKRPVVLLGDNIFHDSLHDLLEMAWDKPDEAFIVLKEVPDPGRYGVVELDGELKTGKSYDWARIVSIEEKPREPRGKHAVAGIYVYPNDVFDVIRELKPSKRGELEITDVNNHYFGQGRLNFYIMEGYWTDAGTHASLQEANRLVLDNPPKFDPMGPYVPETLE